MGLVLSLKTVPFHVMEMETNMAKKEIKFGEHLSVRVPIEILEEARAKSIRTGIKLAFVVREALEAWVEEPEPAQESKGKEK